MLDDPPLVPAVVLLPPPAPAPNDSNNTRDDAEYPLGFVQVPELVIT
jgi:hypothetical protein